MIRATAVDQPEIETFLQRHIATSMFPISNLRRYGMAGGHARAVSFWLRRRAGAITDICTITDGGMLLPQCPTGPWGDLHAVLAGASVTGILGDGAQVAALRAALGLSNPAGLDETDPLYELALENLTIPDATGFSLRPLTKAPRGLVVDWRRAYLEEVLPLPGDDLNAVAIKDIDSYAQADSHRVLFEGDTPVAMTGFNATLPQAVQVGGVYTPTALRARGLARRAVALHLDEARRNGVSHAVLFAASKPASKAYQAIGFRQTGSFAILLYATPQVIHG